MRTAKVEESRAIKEHYDEAVEYANRVGYIDWPMPFPIEAVDSLIANDELYVWGHEEINATAKVSLVAPEKIWGQSERNNLYVYLGKIAGSKSIRGTGYFRDIVLQDVGEFAEAAGRKGIRLDCLAENEGLCKLYTKLGYQEQGIVAFWSQAQNQELTVQRFEFAI